MNFDPALFAQLGKSLTDQGNLDKEARTRTAIGRAYYALYLAIRKVIREAENKATHGRNDRVSHGYLQDTLATASDPNLVVLAETLHELYEARRQADYVLEPQGRWITYCQNPRNAKRLLKRAEAEIRRLPKIDFTEMIGKF